MHGAQVAGTVFTFNIKTPKPGQICPGFLNSCSDSVVILCKIRCIRISYECSQRAVSTTRMYVCSLIAYACFNNSVLFSMYTILKLNEA